MLQHQKHRRKRARSAFFEYKSRRADEYTSDVSYREWLKQVGSDFRQLSSACKNTLEADTAAEFDRYIAYIADEHEDECDEDDLHALGIDGSTYKTALHEVGTSYSPYPTEAYVAAAREIMKLPPDSSTPGFYRTESVLRPCLQKEMLVRDQGAIDVSAQYEYYQPCPIAHPEMCAEEHEPYVAIICEATKATYQCLIDRAAVVCGLRSATGSYFYLRAEGDTVVVVAVVVIV